MPFTFQIDLPERYTLRGRIANGGMAGVWSADDELLGRPVAIKVLADHLTEDAISATRFEREARAAARLSSHPNVVTVYDLGEHAGRAFIVMERLDGGTVADRLRAGRPTPGRALTWLRDVAAALDYAHEHGVVHRDVKPGNLLLDREESLHVADFGIASAAWLPSLTVEGTVLGTAGYLAPEQATGDRTSPASDRYALGIVAFELLTGERPFARESSTAEMTAHISEPVPSIAERGRLPVELDDVFRRALAKRPEDRFGTCAEFVAALRGALDSAAGATRAYVAAPPARVHARSARWPLLVAALGAALVVAVLLGVALSGDKAPARGMQAPPATTPPPVRHTADPHVLNDRAFALMKQGRYSEALPLLKRAVVGLRGTGPADPAEGYANYNLGLTLLQLGSCTKARGYLQRAQSLEPQRPEVASALAGMQQCLAPAKKEHKPKKEHHKARH